MSPAIGTAKGPGELPHEYLFISTDDAQQLKIGEYVYYTATVEGKERQVLARISSRSPVRLYPDAFLADPSLHPGAVARIMGYSLHQSELYELCAAILGYFDHTLGTFINPRIPPRSGSPIHLAPDELLANVLTPMRPGEVGSATVGWLLTRQRDAVPISLSARELTATHLAIIAGTGSGKSYLAGVLLEELLRPCNKGCLLVIDPHGEYKTIEELANAPEFGEQGDPGRRDTQPSLRALNSAGAYRPSIETITPDTFKVRFSALELADLRQLLPALTERQSYLLSEAYRAVTKDKKGRAGQWTYKDLLAAVDMAGGKQGDDGGKGMDSTAGAIKWRIQAMMDSSRVFQDHQHFRLNHLLQPGRCTVLDLSDVDEREQQVIASVLLRKIYESRTRYTAGDRGDSESPDELPYPVFVVLEEAHRFAPHGQEVSSTPILKTILSEGRKFGVGVGLISQRPGKLDGDVLSQCMTQFLMRIVNPLDQDAVAHAVETVGRDLLAELPALSKGQVIIAGNAVNTPVLCQVRPRVTSHGGMSPNVPQEWNAYFSQARQEARKRAEAFYYAPSGQGGAAAPEEDGGY